MHKKIWNIVSFRVGLSNYYHILISWIWCSNVLREGFKKIEKYIFFVFFCYITLTIIIINISNYIILSNVIFEYKILYAENFLLQSEIIDLFQTKSTKNNVRCIFIFRILFRRFRTLTHKVTLFRQMEINIIVPWVIPDAFLRKWIYHGLLRYRREKNKKWIFVLENFQFRHSNFLAIFYHIKEFLLPEYKPG